MKLAINLALSLSTLAVCLWLVWPSAAERTEMLAALRSMDIAYALACVALLPIVHFCRAWRWNNLLAPIGAAQPAGRLLAISSVGFMAILALPARLGELVRPALIRKKGHISASAALGTVAVERIIDGLIVSVMVFVAFFSLRGPTAPGWMMPTAYAALGVFGAALMFLIFAMRRPEATVRFALTVSLLPRISPRIAGVIEAKLLELIRGFAVLRDPANLARFLLWSAAYWIANGVATWLLARGMGVDLSMVGAFATMGLVAVGITLPNSPGLVGQFQWFTMLGVSLYLGHDAIDKSAPMYGQVLAYAIFIHGLQVVWYVGAGLIAVATPHVSFAELWAARKLDGAGEAGDAERA